MVARTEISWPTQPPKPAAGRRLGARIRWGFAGRRDRGRYGSLVADGAHTHATAALVAEVREQQKRVEEWAIAQRHNREVAMARLGIVAEYAPASTEQTVTPVEEGVPLRLRVRNADALRAAAAAARRDAASRSAAGQAAAEIAQLKAEVRLVNEIADAAKARWEEFYCWAASIYARARSHRRTGARSDPSPLVPTWPTTKTREPDTL